MELQSRPIRRLCCALIRAMLDLYIETIEEKGVISVPFALVALLLVLVELTVVFSVFYLVARRKL